MLMHGQINPKLSDEILRNPNRFNALYHSSKKMAILINVDKNSIPGISQNPGKQPYPNLEGTLIGSVEDAIAMTKAEPAAGNIKPMVSIAEPADEKPKVEVQIAQEVPEKIKIVIPKTPQVENKKIVPAETKTKSKPVANQDYMTPD